MIPITTLETYTVAFDFIAEFTVFGSVEESIRPEMTKK